MNERLVLFHGEAEKLRQKYPGRVPVFITRGPSSGDIPNLSKHKYLVPGTFTVGQFLYVIRKQMRLEPEKALFIFVNNTLPASSTTLAEVYAINKSPDGALRMTYTSENTFGTLNLSSYFYSSSSPSLQHRPLEKLLQELLQL